MLCALIYMALLCFIGTKLLLFLNYYSSLLLSFFPCYNLTLVLSKRLNDLLTFFLLIVLVMNKIETETEGIYKKEAHRLLVNNDFL